MTDKPPSEDQAAAIGAAVDQARQEYIELLDALIAGAKRNTSPGAPLDMPVTALTITQGLKKMYVDPDDQLFVAINLLSEAVLRLTWPDPTRNTPPQKETP